MAIKINKTNFKKEIDSYDGYVIVQAYADWCTPCQEMKPIFRELEEEVGDKCKFASLNVDESNDLAIILEITSIPTFIFFKNGNLELKEVGMFNKKILKDKILYFIE